MLDKKKLENRRMTTITTILGEKLLNGKKSAEIDTDELKQKTIGL
jgi:hypothetical protein